MANSVAKQSINIGCAAGAWGDSSLSTAQLLKSEKLDYLVYEALAEVTMAILTRAKMKNPNAGYAIDFINPILKTHLREIRRQNIRVVTNAGGINPQAAANALREIAAEQNIELNVAVVEGDNLMTQLDVLREADVREMAHDTPLPKRVLAMNAYLGAFPIAAALDAGAAGFVLKHTSAEELIRATSVIAEGGAWLDSAVTGKVIEQYRQQRQPLKQSVDIECLTTREREVLALIADGLINTEIAQALFVSEATVKSHISHIFSKLQLRDRAAAIVFAYDQGIVQPRR